MANTDEVVSDPATVKTAALATKYGKGDPFCSGSIACNYKIPCISLVKRRRQMDIRDDEIDRSV